MILLVSASRNVAECIDIVGKELGEEVEYVSALPQATSKLRSGEYAAIVLDQSLLDASPAASEALWTSMGTTIPVYANFAISGANRIIHDLRAALTRRQKEQLLAARTAQAALRNELTGAISGILLSSELALAQPALPSAVADKLRSVHELALQIKARLGTVA